MKIAIISDTHDNIPNIYKALNFIKKQGAEMIIHCGDICAASVMLEIAKKFSGPAHFLLGNVVSDEKTLKKKSEEVKNALVYYKEPVKLRVDNKKIAITHYPDIARQLAESGHFSYVFYGHNHRPWIEKIDDTYLINPGTLGGLFAKPTFALWNTAEKEPRLILLEQLP
ncbi:YfcE family phosphodiesterase [Candidatus Parcubacteria bacterium]|nr:MAG: YfcE family phosphodiesterase [Candidatus Parcubacteria bacterium]